MTAEEIRNVNSAGQTKALETGSVSEHEAALESLKISMIAEVAAQLADLNSFLRWFTDKFTSDGCIDVTTRHP